jgi:RIO-like serine/threonine protein kinase
MGLRGKSYFVMEFVDGVHAGNYFETYREDDPIFATMAARILTLFINLVHLSITHGDLKMTNILIEDQRPILIDFDGMVEHRTQLGLKRAFRKEMERFMENWEKNPGVYALFEKMIAPMVK